MQECPDDTATVSPTADRGSHAGNSSGFMNYFNRFIPRYSGLASVLHEQTSDDAPAWTPACTKAWKALKRALRSATMMYHPDMTRPFHVYSDASIKLLVACCNKKGRMARCILSLSAHVS